MQSRAPHRCGALYISLNLIPAIDGAAAGGYRFLCKAFDEAERDDASIGIDPAYSSF